MDSPEMMRGGSAMTVEEFKSAHGINPLEQITPKRLEEIVELAQKFAAPHNLNMGNWSGSLYEGDVLPFVRCLIECIWDAALTTPNAKRFTRIANHWSEE